MCISSWHASFAAMPVVVPMLCGLAVSIVLSTDDCMMQVSCDSVSARAASVDGLDVH